MAEFSAHEWQAGAHPRGRAGAATAAPATRADRSRRQLRKQVASAGTERQRLRPPHRAERQRVVEMRKQVTAPRNLPFQRAVEGIGIDREQHQVGGAGEMLRRGLDDLRRGREMDEAVARIHGSAAEHTGLLGRAPLGRLADLVDGRHGCASAAIARSDAPSKLRAWNESQAWRIRAPSALGRNQGTPAARRQKNRKICWTWQPAGYYSYDSDKNPRSWLHRNHTMLTHAQIWTALDRLAARAGLSASGLAKKAGLDPTTFNKSKRVTPDGRERWPSTESIAKALTAAGSSIDTFVKLIDGVGDDGSVPLLAFAQAGASGSFDESGFPSGKGWTDIALPTAEDSH